MNQAQNPPIDFELHALRNTEPSDNLPRSPAETERKDTIHIGTVSPEQERLGTETIIYNEPKKLRFNRNAFYIAYLALQYLSHTAALLVAGVLLVLAFQQPPLSFRHLAYFLGGFHCWKIALNAFYFVRYGSRLSELRKSYFFDALLSVGLVVIYFSLAAFFSGAMAVATLPYITVPHIVLTFVRLVVGQALDTPYLPMPFLAFVEAVQFLVIALKLAQPASYAPWSVILVIFFIVAGFALFVALLALLTYCGFLLSFCWRAEVRERVPFVFVFAATAFVFYLLWFSVSYLLLVVGFKYLLESGHIAGRPGEAPPSELLRIAGFLLASGGAVLLVASVMLFFMLKAVLENLFRGDKAKAVSMMTFAKDLEMNARQISSNYFRPRQANAESPPQKSEEANGPTSCVICLDKPVETIIHPCGHGCLCEGCLKDYLKEKDECPFCRKKMDKVYILAKNAGEKEGLLARAVVKINR